MQAYFELQQKIIERFLKAWRLAPWLVYTALPLLFVLVSLLLIARTEYAALLIMVLSWSGFAWLSGRERNYFLQITYPRSVYRKIRLLENVLVALPILLLFVGKTLQSMLAPVDSSLGPVYWGALTLVQGMVGVAMARIITRHRASFTVPTPFSRQPFEFATGIRHYWWLLLIAVFLLIMSVRAANFQLGAFAWFIMVFGAMGFYHKPEPGFYIWVHAMSARALLHRKLRIATQHLLLLSTPFVLTLLIVFPSYWLYLGGGILLAIAYLGFYIVAKYAAYPNEIDLIQSFFIGFGIMMPPLMIFLIPFFTDERSLVWGLYCTNFLMT